MDDESENENAELTASNEQIDEEETSNLVQDIQISDNEVNYFYTI